MNCTDEHIELLQQGIGPLGTFSIGPCDSQPWHPLLVSEKATASTCVHVRSSGSEWSVSVPHTFLFKEGKKTNIKFYYRSPGTLELNDIGSSVFLLPRKRNFGEGSSSSTASHIALHVVVKFSSYGEGEKAYIVVVIKKDTINCAAAGAEDGVDVDEKAGEDGVNVDCTVASLSIRNDSPYR